MADKNYEGMTIKILKTPDVTELDGEKVMIDFESGRYFMIKGTGNDIYGMLEDGLEVNALIDKLLEEYDVSRDLCIKDTFAFLAKLEELGFISFS